MSKHILRLYIAGATERSSQALRAVARMCEEELKGNYELEVIDVYLQPELARRHQIVATPTLVKELPIPVRRLIGDLSNFARLLGGQDLPAAGKAAP